MQGMDKACQKSAHLLWEEILDAVSRTVLCQAIDVDFLADRFDDNGLESVFCMSAELARVRVMRIWHE